MTVRDVLLARGEGQAALEHAISGLRGLPEGFARSAVIKAVLDILDIPLSAVLFRAWEAYGKVQEARAETRGKPGACKRILIARHTVRSNHYPKLEWYLDEKKTFELVLNLELSVQVETVVVLVVAGEVHSVGPGKAVAKASLKVDGVTLAEHEAQVTLEKSMRPPSAADAGVRN